MTDFDFKEIERKAAEEAKKTQEIKEKNLKHVEEVSANAAKPQFEDLTEEQQQYLDQEAKRCGLVKVKTTKEKVKPPPEPEPQKVESEEEGRSNLLDKYENLVTVANYNLPGLWDSLELELSVQKILNIKEYTLPFAGIVLGRPSSLKTIGIELFRKWPNTYYTDNFSAKAFVSHSTAVKREELDKIDMLPKIKNKLFLTPELSPTFSKKDDDLIVQRRTKRNSLFLIMRRFFMIHS